MLYRAFIECFKANFYLCPWPGVLNNVNEGHTCINRYICNGMGEIIMVQTRIWTLALCVINSPIPFTFDARPTPETSLEKTWNIYYKDQRSFGEGGVLEKVRSVRSPESKTLLVTWQSTWSEVQEVQVLIQSSQFPSHYTNVLMRLAIFSPLC